MASLTVIDRKDRTRAGRVRLYLRISHGGKDRYLSLSIQVAASEFDRNRERVRGSEGERYNRIIEDRKAKAKSVLLDMRASGDTFTAGELKAAILRAWSGAVSQESFSAFAHRTVSGYERRGQVLSAERLRVITGKLQAFYKAHAGTKDVPFSALTPRLLNDFATALAEPKPNGWGNAPNTVAKNLKGIRAILYRAIREGLFDQSDNPFFHITITEKKTKKAKLSRADLGRMEALDLPAHSWLSLARDVFLFSVYAAGIRFGDACCLRWDNIRGERLSYKMMKTGQVMNVKLTSKAKTIMERYQGQGRHVFPLIEGVDMKDPQALRNAIDSANTQTNQALSDIAKRADVQVHVTCHVSRGTFASLARDAGWTLSEISKALGHASLRVTERYLATLSDEALDDRMDALFG